jgi:hypothetical protein
MQGMEEFSQAVVEERDLVNEKLKMKESEIEQERILRMELCERLKELQNKVNINLTQTSSRSSRSHLYLVSHRYIVTHHDLRLFSAQFVGNSDQVLQTKGVASVSRSGLNCSAISGIRLLSICTSLSALHHLHTQRSSLLLQ